MNVIRVQLLNEAFQRPFIIDLESTNGTHVNDEQIPTSRFYELKAGDGESSYRGLPKRHRLRAHQS